MKVYSIGRNPECDILVNDPSGVISRRHALISVAPSGKITLTDTSHNGTYVNGVRISPNEPVPVTRKDSITFAHVAKMDWKIIPLPPLIRYAKPAIAGIVAVAIIGIGCAIGFGGSEKETPQPKEEMSVVATDSAKVENEDTTKSQEAEKSKTITEKEKPTKVTKKAKETKAKEVEKTSKSPKIEPKKVEKKKKEEEKKVDVSPQKKSEPTDPTAPPNGKKQGRIR